MSPTVSPTLRFQTQTFEYQSDAQHPQRKKLTFHFDNPVISANAALRGFEAEFVDQERPVHLLFHRITDVRKADYSTRLVEVTVEYGLRDNSSNHYDDKYRGSIDVLVIAQIDEPDRRVN
ncbi:hypothetical protein [Actinokineospora iranica]|uniref:Uncharacterized protein n=1 Tax=Actinokineospora iranica TaxID=1271860 RepID=A0A1G6IT65_9PSEU|nr:hypothetical protein [Actinokineospora iranica]SDC08956.1 hypothetical protein SAMN05216174_10166 [Actinokineospora iranica]